MKKTVSILLALVILIASMSVGFSASAANAVALSVKSNDVGKVTLKWDKCTANGCSGYEIEYTPSDDISTGCYFFKVDKASTVSETISLVEGLTYQIRIRPYFNKTSGVTYGSWSSIKTVCVKASIGGTVDAKKLINGQTLKKVNAKNARLDKILNKILEKYTNSKMSTYEKLFECYKYVSNEKFSNYGITGSSYDWWDIVDGPALELLDTKSGDCGMYNFLFCLLAKKIGIQDVRLVDGVCTAAGGGWTYHIWCMMKLNGHFYTFDPRLEMYNIKSGGSKNGTKYFCVPISDKSSTAQKYRYSLTTSLYEFGDDCLLYGYENLRTPKITSVAVNNSGTVIKWNDNENAQLYRVFYKNSDGKWTKIADTDSSSYTWKGAKAGTKYTFTVRCLGYDGSYISDYDTKGKGFTVAAKPKISSVENASTGVKITWGKAAGAAKYRVFYKANGESSWHKAGDTASTSYTWKGAKSNTKYAFTVRCITSDGKTYTGGYDTTGKSIKYIAAPTMTSVTANSSKTVIQWDKVAGAEKYRVFRKADGGSWKKLADTTSTSYTDNTGKLGSKYSYTVRCISKDGKTTTSAFKAGVMPVVNPAVNSLSKTATGIKISWGKVAGAVNYRVFYKANGESKWHKAGDSTSTSFTWTKAKSNTKYTFTVRCISKDGLTFASGYDNKGKSMNYIAAPKISSVSNTTTGVKISWGKVTGAAKYRVFYKTANSGWTKAGDTTGTSFTWTGAKSGTKYTFTVRCISKDGKSFTSAYNTTGKSITFISAPKISSLSKSSSGITVKWGKVTGAAKYRVFYKTGNGSWKKLADTTSTSYTWKGAKSGTKYTFTVRCISSDGKSFTSAYNTTGKSITR